MDDLTIAVVISNYNYARFLRESLDSVICQKPPFDEIIVVDDGSTDDSIKILESYADQISLITISNTGQLGACLRGIRAAKSTFIYCLDADDFANVGLVARLKTLLTPSIVKLQFQLSSVTTDGGHLDSTFPHYPVGYNSQSMISDITTLGFYRCPPTSGNIFHRITLMSLRLEACDPRGAFDGSIALSMPYMGEIISVNEALASYRVHSGSISGWSAPSKDVLTREIIAHFSSHREVALMLNHTYSPSNVQNNLFIRERELMIASMESDGPSLERVISFIRTNFSTNNSLASRILSSLWTLFLLMPSSSVRQKLVRIKRSSVNRPRIINKLAKIIKKL